MSKSVPSHPVVPSLCHRTRLAIFLVVQSWHESLIKLDGRVCVVTVRQESDSPSSSSLSTSTFSTTSSSLGLCTSSSLRLPANYRGPLAPIRGTHLNAPRYIYTQKTFRFFFLLSFFPSCWIEHTKKRKRERGKMQLFLHTPYIIHTDVLYAINWSNMETLWKNWTSCVARMNWKWLRSRHCFYQVNHEFNGSFYIVNNRSVISQMNNSETMMSDLDGISELNSTQQSTNFTSAAWEYFV